MFIYLSKKIAIPSGSKLKALSWNADHGWLACGGENGLLKVLKLETQESRETNARGIAAPTNLSMNQTLEGHKGNVVVTTWNPQYRKLTTSDQYGLIIVWLLHKGVWFEEMINNRNKSVVRDMKWRGNGQEICIIYEDGAVIVGSVDGNRIWSKDMPAKLSLVEWSPDGRMLVFGTLDGPVLVHNHQGVRIGAVTLHAIADLPGGGVPVVAIEWYDGADGYAFPDIPCLAIGFSNGRVQIGRYEDDNHPVLIDSGLQLTHMKWNTSGTALALAGNRAGVAGGRDVAEVQFYTPFGRYITCLKVPGGAIGSLTWEGGGMRLALAVDSYVYFANVRPDYKWAAFGDTVVYAFTRPDRLEQCVVFWNTKTDERFIKYVKRLLSIHASGENCVLVTATEDEPDPVSGIVLPRDGPVADSTGLPIADQYILILCNAIGSPVDSKYIDVRPDYVAMTPFHIIAASTDTLYLWQYRTQVSKLTSVESATSLRRKEGRERIFHVDDTESGGAAGKDATDGGSASLLGAGLGPVADPICCVAASTKYLLVARESGSVQQYALPTVTLENKFTLRCRPNVMQLNCDSTRFSIIDINNVLSFFDVEARTLTQAGQTVLGEHLPFERKDCWSMLWAEDYPDLWCLMEKTRMYIFRGTDPEEPVLNPGYPCRFTELTITSVLLDEAFLAPEAPSKATMVVEHEIRSLRDTRTLLQKNGLKDSMQFIEDNSHPRLWRLLAETALEKQDLNAAEKAFVSCSDYPGIQFVKRLRLLQDKPKQKAEVAVYFKRFEEAESIYTEIDRRDLCIEMRMRLGDWQRVLQLLQASGTGDDATWTLARTKMGDYWADRQQWAKAIPFYEQARCFEALVECYYVVEDYARLDKLIDALPDASPLLSNIGYKLQSVGLTEGAARALLKAGDVKGAVDSCVLLNLWDKAVELAQQHSLPQIEGLLAKYAQHLLDSGKTLAAIELYRKANRDNESAKLLAKLAADVGRTRIHPLRAKRLYVLAALEVERHRKRTMDLTGATRAGGVASTLLGIGGGGGGGGGRTTLATAATLDTLLKADMDAGTASGEMGAAARTLDVAWHGAEAYHFFLLAQRQLYGGDIAGAMTTAQRLALYEDMLEPRDVYSIIALTAYYNQCFGTCSRAFIKLEGLEGATPAERDGYRDLAFSIFMRARPTDPPDSPANSVKCPTRNCDATLKSWSLNCMACGANFPPCVASGQPIIGTDYWRCKVCRHKALKSEVKDAVACPLCHAAVAAPAPAAAAGTAGGAAAPAGVVGSGASRRDVAGGAGGAPAQPSAAEAARRGSGGPAQPPPPSAAAQADSRKAALAAAAQSAALLLGQA